MTFSQAVEDHKKNLNTQVESYLNTNNIRSPEIVQKEVANYRSSAAEKVRANNLGGALVDLEMARDARSGIFIHKVTDIDPPVLIRDARGVTTPTQSSSESAEMQVLNGIRAAAEVAEMEGKTPELGNFLQKYAENFMDSFHEKCEGKSEKDVQKLVNAEMAVIVGAMKNAGIEKPHKKINLAKDFQNFNDTHFDIATISSISGKDGKPHTVVEAEVGLRDLTPEQKKEYQSINNNSAEKPSWFQSLSESDQKLVSKYADKIAEGKHTIPTQLRESIPGMRNASVKSTTVDGNLVHESMHAGTIAHLGGSSKERQRLTNLNAAQAQSHLPAGTTLHTNTLNSRRPGGNDSEIINRTTAAMSGVGGSQTGTAFNLFRLFGPANDNRGVGNTLNKLAGAVSIEGDPSSEKLIQSALKPRGFLGRMARVFSKSPEKLIEGLVTAGKMSEDVAKTLNQGIALRKNVEAASAFIRIGGDKENLSLKVSTGVNFLTSAVRGVCDNAQQKGLNTSLAPKEVMLTMCASGKDRTGLAEHDQSAQAIAGHLNVNVKDIDGQLLLGGHTGQVAGSVFAGGGTLGCHGTKSENEAGIPASRKEGLSSIISASSSGNKIRKPDKENKDLANETIEHVNNLLSEPEVKSQQSPLKEAVPTNSQTPSPTSTKNEGTPSKNEMKKLAKDVVEESKNENTKPQGRVKKMVAEIEARNVSDLPAAKIERGGKNNRSRC